MLTVSGAAVHGQRDTDADAEYGFSAVGAPEPTTSAPKCRLSCCGARPHCGEPRDNSSETARNLTCTLQEVSGGGKHKECSTTDAETLLPASLDGLGESTDDAAGATQLQEDAANDTVIYNDSLIIFRALCKLADKVASRCACVRARARVCVCVCACVREVCARRWRMCAFGVVTVGCLSYARRNCLRANRTRPWMRAAKCWRWSYCSPYWRTRGQLFDKTNASSIRL